MQGIDAVRRLPDRPTAARWTAELLFAAAYVVAVYEAVVAGAIVLWPNATDSWILLMWIVAATVSGLGLNRVRLIVRRVLRHWWPATAEPHHALASLAAGTSLAGEPDKALENLVGLVAASTGARSAAVWLCGPDGEFQCGARWLKSPDQAAPAEPASVQDIDRLGGLPGVDHVEPILDADGLLGALTLSLGPTRMATPSDLRFLADAANSAGLLLRSFRLSALLTEALREETEQAENLTRSRFRLTAARDAAREQLSREIERRVGETLRSCAEHVEEMIDGRSAEIAAERPDPVPILREMTAELDTAIKDFRGIVHGLYPAALTDHGLAPALDTAVSDLPWQSAFEAPELPRFDRRTEAGLYFCLAAILNALRDFEQDRAGHSPGIRRVRLALQLDRTRERTVLSADLLGADLLVEFASVDDVGVRAVPELLDSGQLEAIRDRVGAMDGRFAFTANDATATFTLEIPVEVFDAAQASGTPDSSREATA